jgi:DNA-nicking Smr family endonuclease
VKKDNTIMKRALEAYAPFMESGSSARSKSLPEKSKNKESLPLKSKTSSLSQQPLSMEHLINLFPPERGHKEERLDLSRHQKVNNIKAERELDLHGCTWLEAEALMHRFIAKAQHDGVIAVRIIHGKGKRSKVEGGVLKDRTIQYLESDKRIKKVTQAGYREGQGGACLAVVKLLSVH